MTPIPITHHTLVTALGHGRAATFEALRDGRSGLVRREEINMAEYLGLRRTRRRHCQSACWRSAWPQP